MLNMITAEDMWFEAFDAESPMDGWSEAHQLCLR